MFLEHWVRMCEICFRSISKAPLVHMHLAVKHTFWFVFVQTFVLQSYDSTIVSVFVGIRCGLIRRANLHLPAYMCFPICCCVVMHMTLATFSVLFSGGFNAMEFRYLLVFAERRWQFNVKFVCCDVSGALGSNV